MLFKYCGIIGLLVNIPITICITVIPPLPSPPLPLPSSPPLPTLSAHPPSVTSPPSLPHPPFPSLPSLQQIHCPFQPKQSPSKVVAFILLVQDSHFCYLFFGDIGPTPSSERRLSFWENSFTPVHESCNTHFTKCLVCNAVDWMGGGRFLFKCATAVRLCAARAARAVRVRHPGHSQSVGKTPSFSFCQVDM